MNLTPMLACAAGVAASLSILPAAQAADIYTPSRAPAAEAYVPYQSFAGFYIGGHIGGAWSDFGGRDNTFLFNTWDPGVPFRANDGNNSAVFGGVQGGYNFQSGSWLYGIEVDTGGIGSISNDRALVLTNPNNPGNVATLRVKGDGGWYGDVTGRLGYTWGPGLLYAKGGFAWFDPNLSVSEAVALNGVVVSSFNNNNNNNNTLTGWTVGAGFEYLLGHNWSIKAEYLHFDFSNDNNGCCFDGVNNWRFFNRDLTVDTVKVGFNYFFRPEPQPLK